MVGVGLMYGQNLDKDTPLKEKLEDLFEIVDSNKIGMMTTRTSDGLLVSRAMVNTILPCLQKRLIDLRLWRDGRTVSTLSLPPIPRLERQPSWTTNHMSTFRSTMGSMYFP